MSDVTPLTLAYLAKLPEQSAKAAAGMNPRDVAALFEAVPTRISARVLQKMEKWPAAQCLQHVSSERAAALLTEIPYQDATVLLRLTSPEHREIVLADVPTVLARDLRQSLAYPRNTVGAWMDISAPMLSLASTTKEAIATIRTFQAQLGGHYPVGDETQRLVGILPAEALLRHSPNTPIINLVQTNVKPLRARLLLREVASEPSWDEFTALPVVGRQNQFVGMLSRIDMRTGLSTIYASLDAADSDKSAPQLLGDALVATITGLLRLLGNESNYDSSRVES